MTFLRSRRIRTGGALTLAAGLALASGLAPAAASTSRALFIAGYHFTAPRGGTLTVHGTIKVPRSTCGLGAFVFAPEVEAKYYVGTGLKVASVTLGLGCAAGVPHGGDPVLLVDSRSRTVHHQLRAGQTVSVTITITRSGASAKLAFSRRSSVTVHGPGGRPRDGEFVVNVPKPPRYSPVRFTGCTVDGRKLSSVRPAAWEAVNRHHQVIGRTSRLSHGTAFTVTY
jgi:hypothetical protein